MTSIGVPVTIVLGGDVMLGRGADQIGAHPGDHALRETWVNDARTYVRLAEEVHGPIPQPAPPGWLWGDAVGMADKLAPAVRVINLETAITADGDFAPGKGIHYRMHPGNIAALTAFRPDVCVLANNHVLDFGPRGLRDTLETLSAAGIAGVGAGPDIDAARRPVLVESGSGGRVVIAAVAAQSSGAPASWAARRHRPGVWWMREPSARSADEIAAEVLAHKHSGDIAVVSVHWGPNWGFGVEPDEIRFAHQVIDAGIDIVYGHSAHHPRPIETYRGRPILYGCGDLIDDYEGIPGRESYRPELRALYAVTMDPTDGGLTGLQMLPLRVRRMRLERAAHTDAEWLRTTVEDISRRFGTRVAHGDDGLLEIRCD